MARYRILLAFTTLALSGCRNDCQQLCREMSQLYADCGYDASREEVSGCIDDYADPDEETLSSCSATVGHLEETLAQKAEDGDACSELDGFNSREVHSSGGK